MLHLKLILAMMLAVLLANCFCVSANWETAGAGSQTSGAYLMAESASSGATVDARAYGAHVTETATIQNNKRTISKTVEGNGYAELYLSTNDEPGIVPVNIVQTIPNDDGIVPVNIVQTILSLPQETTETPENPILKHPPITITGQDTKQTPGFGLLITLLAITAIVMIKRKF